MVKISLATVTSYAFRRAPESNEFEKVELDK